jgi:purine-binding chemotaxis protein CheW
MEAILMRADTVEEFLTFRLGAEEYAIDILQVREIRAREPITAIAGSPAFVRGVIHLRGAIVPIVDLSTKLGLRDAAENAVTIIIMLSGRVLGVMVDAVSDVARLAAGDIRPAPAVPSALPSRFIRGIAPVEGRMLVVVDLARLLTEELLQQVAAEAA